MTSLDEWITSRRIEEVECMVPDMSGIARGKILPSAKFIKGAAAQHQPRREASDPRERHTEAGAA